jgi:hypothetical protein
MTFLTIPIEQYSTILFPIVDTPYLKYRKALCEELLTVGLYDYARTLSDKPIYNTATLKARYQELFNYINGRISNKKNATMTEYENVKSFVKLT